MPPRSRSAAVLALALGLTLSGCSSDADAPDATPTLNAPPVGSFAEGACRLAAPDVLALGEAATMLGQGGSVPTDVKDSLRDAQDRLAALAETAEAPARVALDRLVVSVGLVRVRADGNTYEPALGEALSAAYDAVVVTCTEAPGGVIVPPTASPTAPPASSTAPPTASPSVQP